MGTCWKGDTYSNNKQSFKVGGGGGGGEQLHALEEGFYYYSSLSTLEVLKTYHKFDGDLGTCHTKCHDKQTWMLLK